jgi:hypothetical protein
LRKLKEDIHQKFVQGGESVEGILTQELSTPNADFNSKPIIGAVGGPFVQIAVVLSTLKDKDVEEYDEFFNKKNIAQFIITYVIQAMKSDQFSVLMGKHIEEFMQDSNQTMEDVTKLTGAKAKQFRELMKDRDNGMLNEQCRYISRVANKVGVKEEVWNLVHDVLADVITRKPKAKEGVETKQDQFLKKIKISTPPTELSDIPTKAIVKICIPMVEKKHEDSEDSESEEEGEDQPPKKKEVVLVEAPLEDKVQLVNPKGADYNIMVSNLIILIFFQSFISINSE